MIRESLILKEARMFLKPYRGAKIQERRVRTTHVDVEKRTGCQLTECKVLYQGSADAVDEFGFEVFSFEDSKIISTELALRSKLKLMELETVLD